MKKISYFELATIFLIILISFNCEINLYILKRDVGVDSWISIIIGYIIGIIPLLFVMYIANYKQELNIFEKNKHIFGDILGTIINILISIILFIIGLTLVYNIVSFISTQFLYRTPIIISTIIFIMLVIYGSIKEINVICHVGFLLMFVNIFMFILSDISLMSQLKLDNLLPIMKGDFIDIIIGGLKVACVNILPILIILILPKDKITNPDKFNKAIIIAYILGGIISTILVINTIGVLGIYLTNVYEFSEYMVLKKVRLFGFLERVENVVSVHFITEIYIYITLIFYTLSKNIRERSKHTFMYVNIIVGILLVLGIKLFFNNITLFNNYLDKYFIYIVSLLLLIYLIIILGIKYRCKVDKNISS